jgi:uncharacterized membrane protein YhaH (DUF805 family)
MSVNAALALAHVAAPSITSLLQVFWSDGEGSVASRALTLGRYTGIMNQPSVAGLFYALALLCAIYWGARSRKTLAIFQTLLVMGGLLTVSKAFIFVGLPLWFAYGMTRRGQSVRFTFLTTLAGTGLVGLIATAGELWQGAEYLTRFLQVDFSIALITGGRYGGAEAATSELAREVLAQSPITGFGASGVAVPTDAAWLEVLMLTGLVGLGLLAALVFILVVQVIRLPDTMREERHLLFFILALVIPSLFAFPALTANRLSVALWILLSLLISLADTSPAKVHDTPLLGGAARTRGLSDRLSNFSSSDAPPTDPTPR